VTSTLPTSSTAAARTAGGRPRHPDTDRAILEATFRLLVGEGYEAMSMEGVAAAAGVAKTTVYRRYPTKRDLVLAAMNEVAHFPSDVPDDMPTRDALRRLLGEGAHAIIDSGAWRVMASLLAADAREPGLMDTFRARLIDPRRTVAIRIIERGIERGEVRPDADPRLVTEMFAGAIFARRMILGEEVTEAWLDELMVSLWAAIEAR
jgi:AcrR family transcriptional regulator